MTRDLVVLVVAVALITAAATLLGVDYAMGGWGDGW